MLVTINTDASFHKDSKAGGFAFWIVSNNFKIQKCGFFEEKCRNPTDAETKAIINAIYCVLKQEEGITRIIFNTDSLNSKHILTNDRDKIQRYNLFFGKKLRRRFNKIIKEYNGNFEHEFRHVKAHSGKNDSRSYVNEWCDRHAKAFMWKRHHQITTGNIQLNYQHQSIGTLKASVFWIDGLWYWIPKKVILEQNIDDKRLLIPKWFHDQMKPDLNYIY